MLTKIALLVLIFSGWSSFAAPCGTVLLARGEVEVIIKRSSHLVQVGQNLDCGDIIVSRKNSDLGVSVPSIFKGSVFPQPRIQQGDHWFQRSRKIINNHVGLSSPLVVRCSAWMS